jgi:hypothetical protein
VDDVKQGGGCGAVAAAGIHKDEIDPAVQL